MTACYDSDTGETGGGTADVAVGDQTEYIITPTTPTRSTHSMIIVKKILDWPTLNRTRKPKRIKQPPRYPRRCRPRPRETPGVNPIQSRECKS